MDRSVIARVVVLAGGVFSSFSSLPAVAQETCAPAIEALAEVVLAGRESMPPIQARRFGTRAIYLLTQYGDLGDEAIDRLLSDAVEGRMQGAIDLETAWQVHRGTADLSAEAIAAALVDTAKPSAVRAFLFADQAEAVMAAIAALPEGERYSLGQLVVAVSFDQPDAVKAELGALAAEQGLDWLAAGFAAAAEDPAAWTVRVNGLSPQAVDDLVSIWGWLPTYNGNPVLLRSTALQDGDAQSRAEASLLVGWAFARQPEISFLSTFLNQTSEMAAAANVAKSVLKHFDDEPSPSGPLDAGWLVTLEALAAEGFDPEMLSSLVGGLTFGLNRVGRETIGDILDWIVAVDALRPYLRGEGELPGVPPELLSSAFADWERFVALSRAVREDAPSTVANASPDDLPILAELLETAGLRDLLVQVLQAQPPTPDSVMLADDFAARIDRLCDGHLWHKGEAPLLGGQALYKFDTEAED